MFKYINPGAKIIIEKLNKEGFKSYIVGGAVRNELLLKKVIDYDIVTEAKPEEVIKIFEKTIPTGLKHGTVTVLIDKVPYEVTTMRKEGSYSDSRHPDNVVFVKDIKEDLKRRDFTINAMAFDVDRDELIDIFNGMSDLEKKIIKTVGNPDERFNEDALRILRAVRFTTEYNFNIEPNTLISMANNSYLLKNISVERIFKELSKILVSEFAPRGIKIMLSTGILNIILPELMPMACFNQYSPYHDKDVFEHTLSVLQHTEGNLVLRLAALFHDSGKPYVYSYGEDKKGHFYNHENISYEICDKALKRLKVDNKTRTLVCDLIKKHMVSLDIKKEHKIKKLIRDLGKENIELLFKLKKADFGGKPKEEGVEEKFDNLINKIRKIINENEPLEIKDLDISGEDLLNLGFENNKELGDTLKSLLEVVLRDSKKNKKEILEKEALRIKNTQCKKENKFHKNP